MDSAVDTVVTVVTEGTDTDIRATAVATDCTVVMDMVDTVSAMATEDMADTAMEVMVDTDMAATVMVDTAILDIPAVSEDSSVKLVKVTLCAAKDFKSTFGHQH